MTKFLIGFVLAFGVIVIGCDEGEKNYYEPEYISSEELKSLLDNQADIVVVDVRSEDSYNEGHIPGAISMPSSELKNRYQELPPDKIIVLY